MFGDDMETRHDKTQKSAEDEYILSIKSLLEVVWKRLWTIAAVTVVLVGAAVGLSFLQTPQYSASVQVLVGQGGLTDSPNESLGLQQLTQTMTRIASSRPVAESVAEELDSSGLTADDIGYNLTVEQDSATQVIEISYTDPDPQRAQRVANATGAAFSDYVADLTSNENPITAGVMSSAEVPDSPVSPQPVRNGILAFVLGGMLGVGLAFLIEFFDDSWNSPEEAEQVSGVPTFGIIPEFDGAASAKKALRKGREWAPRPVALDEASVEKIEYLDVVRNGHVAWPVGMALVDAKDKIEEANPKLREMLGYSEGEMRGATFTGFAAHPDDAREHADLHAKLSSGKQDHYQMEKRCVKKDGQIMWGCLTVSVSRDAKGDAGFIVAMFEDITSRKQAEEALRLSEESQRLADERFRAVVEKTPLIVHSFTPDGFSLMSSDAWDEFWHGGEEEQNGSNVFEDEQLRAIGLTPFIEESVKSKGAVTTPDLKYAGGSGGSNGTRSGMERWIRAFIQPVRDEAGRITEVVLMLEDVTARKQTEEMLTKSATDREQFEKDLRKALAERQEIEDELQRARDERKQAEEALRKYEGRFRSLLELAADVAPDQKKRG